MNREEWPRPSFGGGRLLVQGMVCGVGPKAPNAARGTARQLGVTTPEEPAPRYPQVLLAIRTEGVQEYRRLDGGRVCFGWPIWGSDGLYGRAEWSRSSIGRWAARPGHGQVAAKSRLSRG